MAQINLNSIKRIERQRNVVHDEVYSTYSVFELGGERYVQLDTYGRVGRENPEKLSQTIQLNRDTAKFLVDLLSQEFDLR